MFKKIILTSTMLFAFISHAETDPSSQVKAVVSPASPVIITSDYQLNPNYTIHGPWFATQIWIANKAQLPVTIIAAQFDVTGTRKDGSSVTKQITVAPSQYNYTLACSNNVTANIEFSDFGTFQSGEEGDLGVIYRQKDDLPRECSKNTDLAPIIFYVGDLPSMSTDDIVDYSYKVQMKLVGWFGTAEQPADRLQLPVSFVTQ